MTSPSELPPTEPPTTLRPAPRAAPAPSDDRLDPLAPVGGAVAGALVFAFADLATGGGPLRPELFAVAATHALVAALAVVAAGLALAAVGRAFPRGVAPLAWALTAAALVACVASDLDGPGLRARSRAAAIVALLLAACLASASVAVRLGAATLRAGRDGRVPLADPLRALLQIVAAVAAAAVLWGGVAAVALGSILLVGAGVGDFVVRMKSPAASLRTILLATAGIAAAALVAGPRLLPGLYLGVHRAVAVASLLAAAFVATLALRRLAATSRRAATAALLLLAVAAVAKGLSARATDTGLLYGDLVRGARNVATVLPWTESFLARVAPSPAAAPAAAAAADFPPPADAAEIRAALDAAAPGRRGFNVLVLSIDALRADVCGYARDAGSAADASPTPRLDAFAAASAVFERAYTSYPTSHLAYASVFSGLHARLLPPADPAARAGATTPSEAFLPAILRARGFATAASIGAAASWFDDPGAFGCLRPGFGAVAGAPGAAFLDGADVVRAAAAGPALAGGARFFQWIHLMDPHDPYEGPAPQGRANDAFGRYLGDVARADAAFGAVLDLLAARGLADRTIVVVHSDHGEEFGEHGDLRHNTNLYEPQTRVPLVVRVPGLAPRRIAETVGLADVAPTLLDLLDVDDASPRTGRSLAPALLGRADPGGGFAYAEHLASAGAAAPRRAAWRGTLKVVRRLDLPVVEIFDLAADPGERTNLVGRDPAADAARLRFLAACDARIDAVRGGAVATTTDRAARFRAETQELVDFVARRALEGPGAVDAVHVRLCTTFQSLRAEAREAYDAAALERLLGPLVDAAASFDDLSRGRVVMLVGAAGARGLAERTLALVAGPAAATAQALVGRACLGDRSAIPALRAELAASTYGRPDVAAVYLGRLGDDAGRAWIEQALAGGSVDRLGGALLTLSSLPDPRHLAAAVRRLRADPPQTEDLGLVAVEALAPFARDAAVRDVLDGLAELPFPSVRAAADRALDAARPAERRAVARAAARDEAAGRDLLRRFDGVAAATAYLRAAASVGPRIEARYEAVQALRYAGRRDEAARVADDLLRDADDAPARTRARRARDRIDDPIPLVASAFRGRAERLDAPPPFVAGGVFLLRVRVTNEGEAAWPGGPSPLGAWVVSTAPDDAPEPDATLADGAAWLPVEGVLPGESVELAVPCRFPAKAGAFARVFRLRQAGANLPADGLLAE